MNGKPQFELKDLIGASPVFQSVREVIGKIAPHKITVLIEGGTGTGKEWLAHAIHFASPRANREFITIDCSSFAEAFLEAELFGYVRGSFAGAIHDKKGLLEVADGGTVFLNHVSKLSLPLQGKLVRVFNEGVFYKIGGVAEVKVDVRFIAGTAEDLKALNTKRKFRDDLYYQLNAMRITMPPLRERGEDIILLANWFLDVIAKRSGTSKKELTKRAESVLKSYHWPGNIRELEREIEKSVILAGTNGKIDARHFSLSLARRRPSLISKKEVLSGSLKDQKRKIIALLEKNSIREALKKTAGNRTHAAKLLDISRQELLRKISAYKMK